MHPDADAVVNRSEAFLATGRHDRAQAAVAEALAAAPDNPLLHSQHSRVLAAAGKWPEALAAALRCIELDPHSPFAWYRLAVAKSGSADLEAAESAIRHGLDLAAEEWGDGLYLLACVLSDRGGKARLSEAEETILKAIESSPENAEFHYIAACIAQQLEDPRTATARVRAGLAVDPLHTDLQLLHASDSMREPQNRVRSLVSLLQLDPFKVEGHETLGREFWRHHVRVQTVWWLIAVLASALMMWVPQAPMSLFLVVSWGAVIPVQLSGLQVRRSFPNGYRRKMMRRYPAVFWMSWLAVASIVTIPVVVVALYGDHGSVLGSAASYALLLISSASYAVSRLLVLKAQMQIPTLAGLQPRSLLAVLGQDAKTMPATTVCAIAASAALAWSGLSGPHPAATGIFLLSASFGCAWWWTALLFAFSRELPRTFRPPSPQEFWLLVAAVPFIVLAMIVSGVVILMSHHIVP